MCVWGAPVKGRMIGVLITLNYLLQEMLKQLQNKLEQEASNLVSTGRSDILDQLTGRTQADILICNANISV